MDSSRTPVWEQKSCFRAPAIADSISQLTKRTLRIAGTACSATNYIRLRYQNMQYKEASFIDLHNMEVIAIILCE